MTRRPGSRERGFTLFELILATMIVLVMGAIALPDLLNARENYLLRSAASDLANDLQGARIDAITMYDHFRVVRVGSTAYRIERQAGGSWITQSEKDLPRGFSVASPGPAIFTPRGNAKHPQAFTLTNPNGLSRRVVVDSSGRTYVE